MTSLFETHSNVVALERPRKPQATGVALDTRAPERSLWSMFCAYYTRARDCRHLAELDDHALRDIGLTRDQIGRPFWDPWERP
jgi:uncharacterized protein YjiS (DUF1127 family)